MKEKEIVIRSLSDADAVRTRPGMYVGSVATPDLIFAEAIENSMDESFAWKGCDDIAISTNLGGFCYCADNGRGLPITMSVDDPEKTQAFLAVGKLHAGSKFESGGAISTGLHGVGVSCTNFLSSKFVCLSKITEDNWDHSIPAVRSLWENRARKKELFYAVFFEKGELVYEGAMSKGEIEASLWGKKSGITLPTGYSTHILFIPDPTIFDTCKVEIPGQVLTNFLLIQEKFYGRKVVVWAEGEKMVSSGFKGYAFEFTKTIVPADPSLNPELRLYVTYEVSPDLSGKVESGSVNGLVVNNGTHIRWTTEAFSEALRGEFKITHRYLTNGLRMHVLLLASEVGYDSQTKQTLRAISKVKPADMTVPLCKEFIRAFRKAPEYWNLHVQRLNSLAASYRSLTAMEKAESLKAGTTAAALGKLRNELSGKLVDATAGPGDRWNCELFCCFTPHTLVRTYGGPDMNFLQIMERLRSRQDIYTWATTPTGERIPTKILAARETGRVTSLVEVTTSLGASFTCTPDHKFMTRTGEWIQASSLIPGMEMMGIDLMPVEISGVRPYTTRFEVPVYCLEVDNTEHNFPLASGLVAHNCEGLSASSQLVKARKSTRYHAVLPLRGRVINSSGLNEDKLLDNAEMATLFKAIGLGLGINSFISQASTAEEAYSILKEKSRYGKIVISTDADSDGVMISSGLLYTFAKFARFLIDFGMIYVSESPLIVTQSGRLFYPSDTIGTDGLPVELNRKEHYRYLKGLGSSTDEETYNAFFNPATRRLIRVTPENIDYAMALVEEIEKRKALLIEAGILTNPYKL